VKGLIRFLTWARVIDAHDGKVSLTSTVLMLASTAVATAPSPATVGALAIAAALYGHKRFLNAQQARDDKALAEVAKTLADVGRRMSDAERSTAELKQFVTKGNNRDALR
jgi:hypothetical protein